MKEGKSSLMFKRRKVFATRDFPKEFKHALDIMNLESGGQDCGPKGFKHALDIMKDGKSSLMFKRRKVSATRDFPKGFKHVLDIMNLESGGQGCGPKDDRLKATGLYSMFSSYDTPYIRRHRQNNIQERKVRHRFENKVIRDYPKGFKQLAEDFDPKTKGGESFGAENKKQLKQFQTPLLKKSKVSAIRDFPPALVRVILLPNINESLDNTTCNLSDLGHDGHKKSLNLLKHVNACTQSLKEENFPEAGDFIHPKSNVKKESSTMKDFVTADDVNSFDSANMQESTFGLKNAKMDGQPCNPHGNMLCVSLGDVYDFLLSHCHNGFLFEDDIDVKPILVLLREMVLGFTDRTNGQKDV